MAFVFQEAVQNLRDHKKKAYVALLDVQKAFDIVWHNGLFYKLYSYGIKDRPHLADPEEVVPIHYLYIAMGQQAISLLQHQTRGKKRSCSLSPAL